jgi:hypothetical protein
MGADSAVARSKNILSDRSSSGSAITSSDSDKQQPRHKRNIAPKQSK